MTDLFATISAAIVSGLVVYFFGYRKASKDHENKETAQRLDDVKEAQEVRDEIEILDDEGLSTRASQWLRGNNN